MLASYNYNIGTGLVTLFNANPDGPDSAFGPCDEFVVYVTGQNTKISVYGTGDKPLVVDFVQRAGVDYQAYRWSPNKIMKVTAQTATGVAPTVSWGVVGKTWAVL